MTWLTLRFISLIVHAAKEEEGQAALYRVGAAVAHTHTLIHTQAQCKYLNLINYIYKHAAKAIKFATRTRRMLFALKLSVNQIEAPKVAKWIFMLPHAVALWRRLQEIAIPCSKYYSRVLAVGFYICLAFI